jgi:hypothetical protein
MSLRKLMTIIALSVALVGTPPLVQQAYAQPVIDVSQIGGFAQKAKNLIDQIMQMKAQAEQYIAQIKGYMNQAKALAEGGLAGLLSMLDFGALIPKLPQALSAIQGKVDNPDEAAAAAEEGMLGDGGEKDGDAVNEMAEMRKAAAMQAAANGFAVAVYQRDAASKIEETIDKVEQGMSGTADQAADWKANSKGVVEVVRGLSAISSILSAQLEVMTTSTLTTFSMEEPE